MTEIALFNSLDAIHQPQSLVCKLITYVCFVIKILLVELVGQEIHPKIITSSVALPIINY